MDKNSTIGLVLIFAIVAGYSFWKMPSAEERALQVATADSIAVVQQAQQRAEADLERTLSENTPEATVPTPEVAIDSTEQIRLDSISAVQAISKFGLFQQASQGAEESTVLETELIELTLSAKGGAPASIRLKGYKQYHPEGNGDVVQLFDPDSNEFAYRFNVDGRLINSNDLYFKVVDQGDNKVTLRANAGSADKYIELVYRLTEGSYLVEHELNIVGLEREVNPSNVSLNWNMAGFKNEKGIEFERQSCSIFYKYNGDKRDYLSEGDSDTEQLNGKTNWVAFKQKFFTLGIISDKGFSGNGSEISIIPCEDSLHTKSYRAKLYFDERESAHVSIPIRFYMGPNHYQTLEATEVPEFDRIIDLGWGIFGWMNRWLVIPIFNWLSGFGWGYGIIILVLTFIIKGMLFPITWKNYMSSAKMRVLRPQIDILNEKFKDKDAAKKQQATMELYRKTGVNPMAGCLPALLQMPILYAMFRFFPSSIELRQQSFLWADDLSNYDEIFSWTQEIPLLSSIYGNHISLFTLLMAASTFFYTRMNSNQMPTQPGMPNMKVIMNLFPIMMLFFFNKFSAGLSYYYLLANLISIAQMFVIKKYMVDEDKIKLQLEENKKKPKKKSRWMSKMEEIQKQQESQKRGRRK